MFPEAHFFFLGDEGLSSILIILLKLALGIPGGGCRVTCVGVGRNCLGKSLPVPGGSAAAGSTTLCPKTAAGQRSTWSLDVVKKGWKLPEARDTC